MRIVELLNEEVMTVNKKLNPVLWEGGSLKPEIREKLQEAQKKWREKNPDYMKNYDDSHSFEHVLRVKHMATKIGLSENLDENQIFIIQLGALTHDINDSKYNNGENTQEDILRIFFNNLIKDKQELEKIIADKDAEIEKLKIKKAKSLAKVMEIPEINKVSTAKEKDDF